MVDPISSLPSFGTGLLSDVTDELGIRDNVIPLRGLEPLLSDVGVAGIARTITYERGPNPNSKREALEPWFELLESVRPGDFIVVTGPDGFAPGLWGGLLSQLADREGVVGSLIDGNHRDSTAIIDRGYPVWSKGRSAVSAFGRGVPTAVDATVTVDDVVIKSGDVLVADDDAVLRMGQEQVAKVHAEAKQRARTEASVRQDIRSGDSLRQSWNKRGVI